VVSGGHLVVDVGGGEVPYAVGMGVWPLRGLVADVVVAAATGVFVVGTTVGAPERAGVTPGLWGWVLLVGSCAVLVFRRRCPVAVLVATLVGCGLYYPLVNAGGPIVLTYVVALFSAAAAGRVVVAVGVTGAGFVVVLVGEVVGSRRHLDNIALFMLAGWLVAVIAVGAVLHGRRVYLREASWRAAAAAREAEAEASRQAAEERLRIARELHDVLGHNVSLINVQAGAALHRLDRSGTPVSRDVLAAIKDISRQALRELRGTLGVLRQVDEPAPLEQPPVLGLAALDQLLDHARSAGLEVRCEIDGEPAPIPAGVDLAAYRIVQEALTNVTRHACAASVVVRVRFGNGEVCVEVDDDGTGVPDGTVMSGNGIQGMTERARELGGTLTASTRAGGGFTVLARLPLADAS
jgi:signal transduction histidine kinase